MHRIYDGYKREEFTGMILYDMTFYPVCLISNVLLLASLY